jgi:hypothetical protein
MESRKFAYYGQLKVNQLHPPPRTLREHNQDLTIIFFRGSTNESSGWKNTWIQRGDPNVCWPRDWLPKAVEKWGLRRGMLVLAVSYPPGPDYCREPVAKIAYELMEILLHRCHALLWLPVICFLVVWLESIVLILPLIISASHLGLCFNHNCVLRFPHHTLQ